MDTGARHLLMNTSFVCSCGERFENFERLKEHVNNTHLTATSAEPPCRTTAGSVQLVLVLISICEVLLIHRHFSSHLQHSTSFAQSAATSLPPSGGNNYIDARFSSIVNFGSDC